MVKRLRQKIKVATQDLDKNIRTALYVVAALALWMFTGLLSFDKEEEVTKEAQLKTVAVYELTEQPYTEMLTVTGRSEPETAALVGAQIEGEVEKVHFQIGDAVKKGDSLLTFTPSGRTERLKAAQAQLKETQVLYRAAKKLNKEGYQSDTTLATRLAALTSAQESLALAKKSVDDGNMLSPIDGIVVAKDVQNGHFLKKGATAYVILNEEHFLIVAHIAQKDHSSIRVGQPVTAKLINGDIVEGVVRALSNHADDVTKTYRLEVLIDGQKFKIPTGMTAQLKIPIQETMAHLIPQSSLIIGDKGTPGIKIVNEDNLVEFKEIEWFENLKEGLWVTGLSKTARVVVRGQNLVIGGEEVNVTVLKQEQAEEMEKKGA